MEISHAGCHLYFHNYLDKPNIIYTFAKNIPTIKLSSNLNCRANRVQTKACFQYAEAQPTIKRSLNLKPQTSKFKSKISNLKNKT